VHDFAERLSGRTAILINPVRFVVMVGVSESSSSAAALAWITKEVRP